MKLVHDPMLLVVIKLEVSNAEIFLTTASMMLPVGLNNTSCSPADPPSVSNPSSVVGMLPLVHPQVLQLRFTVTFVVRLAQGALITF